MTPLTTVQGLWGEPLKTIINNRAVFIWGCGPLGCGVLNSLQKANIPVSGFLDSRNLRESATVCNLPVVHPENIVKDPASFIIIATLQAKNDAVALCKSYGKEKSVSYLTHYQIARPTAVIDISGSDSFASRHFSQKTTNDVRKDGLMSLSTYTKIFEKLILEMPALIQIDMGLWAEPFLNPDLPKIITRTEPGIACSVSTNLLHGEMIASVIRSNPNQINIIVNDYKDAYEKNMPGASWDTLIKNCRELSQQRDIAQSTSKIRIIAYKYAKKPFELQQMKHMANQLKFELSVGHAYVSPYELYLQYALGNELPPVVRKKIENQEWDFDSMLLLARKDKENPCLCQRIFPIIHWDTSVSLCHMYYGPVIAKNFLEISWHDLLMRRHSDEQCRQCQEMGLHRLDIDVIERKYGRSIKEK